MNYFGLILINRNLLLILTLFTSNAFKLMQETQQEYKKFVREYFFVYANGINDMEIITM